MPSPGQISTFRRGRAARLAGQPREACPYHPKPGRGGVIDSGARGYANAWLRGWDEADREMQSRQQQTEEVSR